VSGVGHLEPCELGAVLPCPLSHVVLAIHLGVAQCHSVILIECDSVLIGVLLEYWELQLHIVTYDA
jgi:hypothetical protein